MASEPFTFSLPYSLKLAALSDSSRNTDLPSALLLFELSSFSMLSFVQLSPLSAEE